MLLNILENSLTKPGLSYLEATLHTTIYQAGF